MRTLAELRAVGAKHPAGAFAARLDLEAYRGLASDITHLRMVFHESLLARLDAQGDDPELSEVVREMVAHGRLRLGKDVQEASPVERWRADPSWPETLKARGRELADAAISDKPSKHVRERLEAGVPAEEVGVWMKALLSAVGRGKLVRQALKGVLKR